MIDGYAVDRFRGTENGVIGSTVAAANAVVGPFHLEPRCRVCRTDDVRQTVNSMLAAGCSYAGIVRSLVANNAELPDCDRVSVDSVRNHAARHFPVQNLAQATYREVLQQRAQQNQIDIAEGLATALTPMAFMEAVMAKSFATLAQSDTEVAVALGCDPATLYAATAPLPPGIDELLLAGFLRNSPVETVKGATVDLMAGLIQTALRR